MHDDRILKSGHAGDRLRSESWLGRLGIGLVCSSIIAIIMNFAGLKWLVLYLFAGTLSIFGWHVKPPERDAIALKGKLDQLKGGASLHPGLGKDAMALTVEGARLEREELKGERDRKAAEEKAERDRKHDEAERDKLHVRARAIGLDFAPEWSTAQLRAEVEQAEFQVAEEGRKKPYYARADKIGFVVDPTVDAKTLKQQVEEAEKEVAADADYQAKHRAWERAMEEWQWNSAHGSNSRCPNPRCRHAMRIADARMKGKGVCPKCNLIFPCRQARACWTPPPAPKEPAASKKNPGLLRRVFG